MNELEYVDDILVDKNAYPVLDVKVIHHDTFLRHVEDHIAPNALPDLYKRGVYLPNDKSPIFIPEMGVKTSDGFYDFNTIDDLENLIKAHGVIYDLTNKGWGIEEFSIVKNSLSYVSRYPILTEMLTDYTINRYNFIYHTESELVVKDMLNISNHIYLQFPLIDIADMHVVDTWGYLYYLNPAIDRSSVEHIKIYMSSYIDKLSDILSQVDPLVVDFKINNNLTMLEVKPSFSSRRYYLNTKLQQRI